MSVLVWWVVPISATLLTLVAAAVVNRLMRMDRKTTDIEGFERFRAALERPIATDTGGGAARRGSR